MGKKSFPGVIKNSIFFYMLPRCNAAQIPCRECLEVCMHITTVSKVMMKVPYLVKLDVECFLIVLHQRLFLNIFYMYQYYK